jgi:microcystin-dependent protein
LCASQDGVYPSERFSRWLDELLRRVNDISVEYQPVGAIVATVAEDEPQSGWLFCNGQAVSKSEYNDLYQIIGNTFGETALTFNLPDLSDRFLVGADTIARMATGGAATVTLAEANLPAHNHGVTDPGHTHTFTGIAHNHGITDPGHVHTAVTQDTTGTSGSDNVGASSGDTASATTGVTVDNATAGGTNSTETTGITTNNTGGGTAFDITPPALGVNWLIKT